MGLRVHALYLTLGDAEFLGASNRSVYDHVTGITVATTYDRDWQGRPREPDGAAQAILARTSDPEAKIGLVAMGETNEARLRNRVMDLVAGTRASLRVRRQHPLDRPLVVPDYFLIVDADEVWEAGDLERLFSHAATHRGPRYRAGAVRYFRNWNTRIDGYEWSTVLVRADRRLNDLRNHRVGLPRRALAKVAPRRLHDALLTTSDVPAEVAVFHHGSYVGGRDRIEAKLASFGHAHEVRPGWLEDVWDGWSVDRRDFHPVWPKLFPTATEVPTERLPPAIRASAWPQGWLA